MLKNVRVVLALGRIAFDAYCKAEKVRVPSAHGMQHILQNGKTLIASYHPSRQNTNTGKLTWSMWLDIFQMARMKLEG